MCLCVSIYMYIYMYMCIYARVAVFWHQGVKGDHVGVTGAVSSFDLFN